MLRLPPSLPPFAANLPFASPYHIVLTSNLSTDPQWLLLPPFPFFQGPLAGKAVVLVTNQLQFLPYVDKIVVMGPMEGGNGDVGIIDQVGKEGGREAGRETK